MILRVPHALGDNADVPYRTMPLGMVLTRAGLVTVSPFPTPVVENVAAHPRLTLADREQLLLLLLQEDHCMAWHIPHTMGRGIGGIDPLPAGIPRESDYVRRYCERTGRGVPVALAADWNFYLAYNLFRLAAILQGIAKRVVDGTAASAEAKAAGAGARPLAEMGWAIAQRA